MTRLHGFALSVLVCCYVGCASQSGRMSDRGLTEASRKDAAETQVALGVGYMEKGKYEYALERLTRAIELDPRSSGAYTSLGLLYERIRDPVKAEEHYRKATVLEPKRGSVHNNLGQFLCSSKRYAEATSEFELALADPFYKTPELAAANAGTCARLGGDMAAAEKFLRIALERRPDFIEAFYPMAEVLHARGENMKARAFVQRYESANLPQTAEFLTLAAKVELKLKNAKGAGEYVERLRNEFPDSEYNEQFKMEGAQ